jgi:hypothetical protein
MEKHLIDVPTKSFDDFAGAGSDAARNRRILGIGSPNPSRLGKIQ